MATGHDPGHRTGPQDHRRRPRRRPRRARDPDRRTRARSAWRGAWRAIVARARRPRRAARRLAGRVPARAQAAVRAAQPGGHVADPPRDRSRTAPRGARSAPACSARRSASSMSVVVGVAIGIALAASPLLRRAFGPIITGLQSLPSVAWVPAAIIWFGLTDATMYAVVLLGAVPSIVNGLLAGTDQVPPLYLRVGQVLGATRLDADPLRAAARRAARLPRRAQAGLGVRVALAHGRRAHRPDRRSAPGSGRSSTSAGSPATCRW